MEVCYDMKKTAFLISVAGRGAECTGQQRFSYNLQKSHILLCTTAELTQAPNAITCI